MARGKGKGPLVKVELAPGRFVKMYKRDAAALELLKPPSQPSPASGGGGKARPAVEPGAGAEVSTRVLSEAESGYVERIDDFTVIDGIGAATAEMLHRRGILTIEALREVKVDDLPVRVRRAVEAWRDGE